jgi:hypothetical protein
MTHAEQDQLSAEIGTERHADPAQEEVEHRCGFDMAAYANRLLRQMGGQK